MAADLALAVASAAAGDFAAADALCDAVALEQCAAAHVLRASMWRQLGDPQRARIWDDRGRVEACDDATCSDAQIGLAADALAAGELTRCASLLGDIVEPISDRRVRIRWFWVQAEFALACGADQTAKDAAHQAIRAAHEFDSLRHLVKSRLIAAVADHDVRAAIACAHDAADHGWRYLAWASTVFLMEHGEVRWAHWADDLARSIDLRLNPAQAQVWRANPAVRAARVALGYV